MAQEKGELQPLLSKKEREIQKQKEKQKDLLNLLD